FKLQVVENYLIGKSGGLNFIARKYGLKSKIHVENWVKKHSKNPELLKQGLRGKTSTGHPQFIKLEAMTLEEQNE
ncbi:TPA: transposase, partial [Streptococcus suis]